jgi:hypothetical protein
MRSLIFRDIENVGPAAYAYEAIDAGLPMEPFDRVTLTCGAIISICRSLAAENQEPAQTLYGHLYTALKEIDRLEPREREMVDELVTMARNSYAVSVAAAREALLAEGFKALGRLSMSLSGVPKYRLNWTALAQSLQPLSEMADDSLRTLKWARELARSEEIIKGIDMIINEFTRLRGFAINPKSAF